MALGFLQNYKLAKFRIRYHEDHRFDSCLSLNLFQQLILKLFNIVLQLLGSCLSFFQYLFLFVIHYRTLAMIKPDAVLQMGMFELSNLFIYILIIIILQ